MIPLGSHCFVNECMIRVKGFNELLEVINETEGWTTATNTTNLFTVFVGSGGSAKYCSSDTSTTDAEPYNDTTWYIIQMAVYSVGILVGIGNVSLHLIFREMRTTSGILITILCTSMSVTFVIGALRITIVYYYQVNIPIVVCAIAFDFLPVITISAYEATKTTILVHFAYSMYRSYKVLRPIKNKRSLLHKYIIFISVHSTVTSVIIITFAIRNGFDEKCIHFFSTSKNKDVASSKVIVITYVIVLIWMFAKMILALTGLTLYLSIAKRCCAASTTSCKDFRVPIILTSIVGLSAILFCVLKLTHTPLVIVYLTISFATVTEQVILFALFMSSSKVACCRSAFIKH